MTEPSQEAEAVVTEWERASRYPKLGATRPGLVRLVDAALRKERLETLEREGRLVKALEAARAKFHGLAAAAALDLRGDYAISMERLHELLQAGNVAASEALMAHAAEIASLQPREAPKGETKHDLGNYGCSQNIPLGQSDEAPCSCHPKGEETKA